MTITIEGVSNTPLWSTLQEALTQMLDTDGRIVRISRKDGQCDYRTTGEYDVDFCPLPTGDLVSVSLVVRR